MARTVKRYGYKVCYKEANKKRYIRHFLTHTYKQAKAAMDGYIRYPPLSREDRHVLVNPKWKIIPVTKTEVRQGIWRECPF